ncbi:MAG: hypothetical protein ACFCGT_25550 [Sandaracinaceae bacterium]
MLQCNDLKVPACQGPPTSIYLETRVPGLDITPGGLIPVSTDTEDGSCDGFEEPCRPTPVCERVGRSPSCPATGTAAICVFVDNDDVPEAPPTGE